jgi:hypothetical protein
VKTATSDGEQVNRLKALWRNGHAALGAIATIPLLGAESD